MSGSVCGWGTWRFQAYSKWIAQYTRRCSGTCNKVTRYEIQQWSSVSDTDPRKGEGNTGTVKNKLEERAKMLVAIINSARVTPLKMVTNMFASGGIPPGYWWPNISLLEVFEWDVGEKPTSYLNIPSSKEFGGH
ncbi:hypothetical protein EDB19DRAFT_1838830 [Suillus lakei]|nr:hypothetical protein EDB19DRAFT_1838830 [Suillus lakei]